MRHGGAHALGHQLGATMSHGTRTSAPPQSPTSDATLMTRSLQKVRRDRGRAGSGTKAPVGTRLNQADQ